MQQIQNSFGLQLKGQLSSQTKIAHIGIPLENLRQVNSRGIGPGSQAAA